MTPDEEKTVRQMLEKGVQRHEEKTVREILKKGVRRQRLSEGRVLLIDKCRHIIISERDLLIIESEIKAEHDSYWKARCKLAEEYIRTSRLPLSKMPSCIKAYNKWKKYIQITEKP